VAVEKLFSARTAENRIASGCPINGFLDFRYISGHQIWRHFATCRAEKDFSTPTGLMRWSAASISPKWDDQAAAYIRRIVACTSLLSALIWARLFFTSSLWMSATVAAIGNGAAFHKGREFAA
jgi:hypothetical protein